MRKHLKKFMISIMLVVIITFAVVPPSAHAIDVGGILLKPFTALLAGVLDSANGWMTYFIVGVSNGFVSWAQMTLDDVVNALSDENTYGNYKQMTPVDKIGQGVQIGISNLASALVSMEDFFKGTINLANINIFKDMPNQSVFSYINQFIRNISNRK